MSKHLGGHPDKVPLTKEERLAITRLKRLAKEWPKSLHLFTDGSGDLTVLRKNSVGEQVRIPSGDGTLSLDQEYIVGDCHIEVDGGDW